MRLLIYSDIHLEFSEFLPLASGYDAVVLAGDIGLGTQGVEWAIRRFGETPVLYVFGNHEFYHHEIKDVWRKACELAEDTNVHLLENETLVIADVEFVGATLWTDFNLTGDPIAGKLQAALRMNDYRQIRHGEHRLLPDQTQGYHFESRRFLNDQLAADSVLRKRVVITHHAPSDRSLTGERIGYDIGFAYASALDDLVESSGAQIWIHGHTHEPVDYRIGDTRVISNPRGYSLTPNISASSKFRSDCVVEV